MEECRSLRRRVFVQREVALKVPADVALLEELTPLAEALEQAQQRVDQVSALREALEWKVCICPLHY